MGLFQRLKKLFSRDGEKQETEIINIGDLMQIPGREYFSNDQASLDLIDKYKEECLKILSQRKTVVTKEISNNELVSKKEMYMNLLLRMIMKEDYYDYENQTLLDNKIILLKLKIYLDEISKIENETIARIIALVELDGSRRVPIRNRKVLKGEIDNLKLSLYNLFFQKSSVKNEIDNYLMHISISDDKLYPSVIEKRRDQTLKYASYILYGKTLFSQSELEDNNINKQMAIIAILETKMEEELYKNKPNVWVTDLTWAADSIGCTPDLNYRDTKSIKDKLISDLNELEDKFMGYYLYGKDIIKEEDLCRLYSAKFRILTFDVFERYDDYDLSYHIFNSYNKIENKVYEDIIFRKKAEILSGENNVIRAIRLKLGDGAALKITRLLSAYFKEDSARYTFYGDTEWRHSDAAIRLILALNSKNDLDRFFNQKIKTKTLPFESPFYELKLKPGEERQFTFDDILPLKTMLEVIPDDNKSLYYKCLKELYALSKKVYGEYYLMPEGKDIAYKHSLPDGTYYILPEGIKEILGFYHPYGSYASRVVDEAKGKTVIMPSSLKEIYGSLFKSSDINGIILNDGLEKIKRFASIKPCSNIFSVPASVEDCDSASFNTEVADTIRFKDYQNSKVLKNPEALGKLLSDGLLCKTLKFKNHRTDVDISYIKTRVDVYVKVTAIPENLKYIILEADGRDIIKINLDDIPCYGMLKDMVAKEKEYKVKGELATRFARKLIERIEDETFKLEQGQNSKKKVRKVS